MGRQRSRVQRRTRANLGRDVRLFVLADLNALHHKRNAHDGAVSLCRWAHLSYYVVRTRATASSSTSVSGVASDATPMAVSAGHRHPSLSRSHREALGPTQLDQCSKSYPCGARLSIRMCRHGLEKS
jgi:hypothetical protein